jgi:F-type H+-transporting ATPase subunit epsilon
MMTLLRFGLARFRVLGEDWEYLALPGALAYFLDGELHLSTRHYLRGKDYDKISTALEQELLVEEDNLQVVKQSLHRLEEEMFKRLWKLKRTGEAL